MKRYKLISCLFIILLVGCIFEQPPKKIVGSYFLNEINGRTDLSYNLKDDQFVGVVDPQIIEVGYNSKYIIVKKRNTKFGDEKIKGEIEYYIIPIVSKVAEFPDDNKIGPLKKSEFVLKQSEFGIDEVKFTIKVDH